MTDAERDDAGLRPEGTALPPGEAELSFVANVCRSGLCIVSCLGGTVSVCFSRVCMAMSFSSSASAPPSPLRAKSFGVIACLGDLADALRVGVRALLARRRGLAPVRPRWSCDRPPKVAVEERDCPESEAGARAALWTLGSDGTSPIPPMEWDPSPSDLIDRRSIVISANRQEISRRNNADDQRTALKLNV